MGTSSLQGSARAESCALLTWIRQLAENMVCVNDGSRDATLEILLNLCTEDDRIVVVDLAPNFTPGYKAGRYLARSGLNFKPNLFQSTPGYKAGRYRGVHEPHRRRHVSIHARL